MPTTRTTATKAHAGAAGVLIAWLLARYGIGDAPPPADFVSALTDIAMAAGIALAGWIGVYVPANQPKE
jgi:hypothetical protein